MMEDREHLGKTKVTCWHNKNNWQIVNFVLKYYSLSNLISNTYKKYVIFKMYYKIFYSKYKDVKYSIASIKMNFV
jgi:hypothetical protein